MPFVDNLGADRSRDFDSLSDARAFRATIKLAEEAKPGYEPISAFRWQRRQRVNTTSPWHGPPRVPALDSQCLTLLAQPVTPV